MSRKAHHYYEYEFAGDRRRPRLPHRDRRRTDPRPASCVRRAYTNSYEELRALFPPIGWQTDAVVEQIHRWHPPVAVRLSIRPANLESFEWVCDFCGEPTTLSPGGDALVLDVRSNDGPGSHTVISHRRCLAERIRPESTGERVRALKIEHM
ncbi:hypothetical protein KGA66_17430 [Actinocrinis puniceicyclus]|uniref:Uncharacterized protein n=1 Tax=Actinocrinis puniceicyclus TaxID=977794 RepID=A0A8J7WLZ4_9ACTN|nr:hypothetical protein [Actinocrinis puniceicyclus]MBS2964843.1 hypothetical protein [Actinocrinis puniceicyclus]